MRLARFVVLGLFDNHERDFVFYGVSVGYIQIRYLYTKRETDDAYGVRRSRRSTRTAFLTDSLSVRRTSLLLTPASYSVY